MKNTTKIITGFIVFVLVNACHSNQISKQQVKSLDSLSGAINTAIQSLHKTDTIDLKRVLNQFEDYAHFIESKLNDTLTKAEALDLKRFFESATHLKAFIQNKTNLLQRLALLNTQITKLSQDITNNSISEQEAAIYFKNETTEANRITPLVFEQEQNCYLHFQKLKQSISQVEEIIKQHNQNQLPLVISNNQTN